MDTIQTLGRREAIDMLQKHGVTPTHQRVEIAQILFAKPQHVCAEELLAQVNTYGSYVSKATVYNTLNLFASKGLVREVIVDPAKVFYDSTTTPHYHFFNVDTGELSDMPMPTLAVEQLPELPAGTALAGIDVIVRVRKAD